MLLVILLMFFVYLKFSEEEKEGFLEKSSVIFLGSYYFGRGWWVCFCSFWLFRKLLFFLFREDKIFFSGFIGCYRNSLDYT